MLSLEQLNEIETLYLKRMKSKIQGFVHPFYVICLDEEDSIYSGYQLEFNKFYICNAELTSHHPLTKDEQMINLVGIKLDNSKYFKRERFAIVSMIPPFKQIPN